MSLKNIREQLDDIDRRLLETLAARQEIIQDVASLKADNAGRIRDFQREEDILARLSEQAREVGLDGYFVTSLYQKILDYSVRYQTDHLVDRRNPGRTAEHTIVSYQGTEGATAHLAARHHFSSRAAEHRYHGYRTVREAVEAVERGDAAYAVLPIENTTAGSMNETYDLLAQSEVFLVGEEVMKEEHCLVAIEEVPLGLIRRISSHPQAIAQCSTFVSSLKDCHVETYLDSALAVRKVWEDKDLSHAAIATEEAARAYDLHVVKRHIANQKENYTRFVVVAREAVHFDLQIPCKTSLVFGTKDEHGALMHCLDVFNAHDLNLSKLESRPRWNMPWEYLFYVDLEGNRDDPDVARALDELAAETTYLKVLGSYPNRTDEARQGVATGRAAAARRTAPDAAAPSAPSPAPQRAPDVVVIEKKPYKLVSRAEHPEDTVVRAGNATIGGAAPVLIAGPCSVESAEQIHATAKAVFEGGGDVLRGGCFKPRTSPYSFQGLGYEGLDLLCEAGQAYGLPVVTEVLHPSDVEPVARQADIVQIGARNMQNFALLKAVGRIDRPVLLKRGMMASIDEWLSAAEYVVAHGNAQVILCERGIRTFETATRNTLDVSAIPVVRELTHLPVIADPAHACGTWRWVTPLAEAAMAAGAHGVMVEVHPDPEHALSDGPQSLKFDTFRHLAGRFAALREASQDR